jgi:hypothetical protein
MTDKTFSSKQGSTEEITITRGDLFEFQIATIKSFFETQIQPGLEQLKNYFENGDLAARILHDLKAARAAGYEQALADLKMERITKLVERNADGHISKIHELQPKQPKKEGWPL